LVNLAQFGSQKTASAGTAKRLRNSTESVQTKTMIVKLVACSQCGERFAIGHDAATPDPELAERQARWLEDQFVWDHIQENKHRSSIALPAWDELK
jgi:hypothetical protein